jgi:hypothetical protein
MFYGALYSESLGRECPLEGEIYVGNGSSARSLKAARE